MGQDTVSQLLWRRIYKEKAQDSEDKQCCVKSFVYYDSSQTHGMGLLDFRETQKNLIGGYG
jgi:hypothetical protein